MHDNRKLIYYNFVTYDGCDWFWSMNFNVLFSRNIKSGKIKRMSDYIKSSNPQYNNVVLYEDKIIGIPNFAKDIMIFDLSKNTFRFVNLEISNIESEDIAFYGYAQLENWLFMAGSQIPYILKFNMKTEKIESVINLFPQEQKRRIYFRDIILNENILVIPMFEENWLFEVDTESLEWTKRKVQGLNGGFSSICKGEDSIWLLAKKGIILQWYREKDVFRKYEEKVSNVCKESTMYFHSGIYLNNKIWLFPFAGDIVLSIDSKTGEISSDNAINRYLSERVSKPKGCKFRAVQMVSEYIYLLCCYTGVGEFLIYNTKRDELTYRVGYNEISNLEYLEYLYRLNNGMIVEKEISIKDFIDFIVLPLGEIERKKHY